MDQRTGNPMPGTVFDRGVTSHYLWDFFLQAHKGLQGTARPAHYIVLKDELNFSQDALESFRGRMYLYSTLNENQSASGSAYNAQTAEWTQGVHTRLTEKTFYV
ncbi:hypothetical protein M436DRAFT_79953 [Aureobasidium namibiae CBS 147.97]|uniref:Piwi domain-containing protein n=1 Tax=Aureobasidium namibiae CBS 147.97 TaxID=1043004 RepID=A0A074WVH0_9PEZI